VGRLSQRYLRRFQLAPSLPDSAKRTRGVIRPPGVRPRQGARRRIANPKDSPARRTAPLGDARRRQVNPKDSPASGLPRRRRGDIARRLGRCRPCRRWNRSSTRSNRKESSRSEFRYREGRTPVGSPGCRSGSGGPRIRPHREARRPPRERGGEIDKQRPSKASPSALRPQSIAKSGALRRLHQRARQNRLPAPPISLTAGDPSIIARRLRKQLKVAPRGESACHRARSTASRTLAARGQSAIRQSLVFERERCYLRRQIPTGFPYREGPRKPRGLFRVWPQPVAQQPIQSRSNRRAHSENDQKERTGRHG
jgi:hypothetical protein